MESQELPEPGAQFKCLLYAEPVFGDNGPFELLVNYDRKQLARMQVSDPKELGPGGRSRWHRFTDETIANVTRTGGGGAFVLELQAPTGSVICFDTGNIHHGKKLARGSRHAATIYFASPRPKRIEHE